MSSCDEYSGVRKADAGKYLRKRSAGPEAERGPEGTKESRDTGLECWILSQDNAEGLKNSLEWNCQVRS